MMKAGPRNIGQYLNDEERARACSVSYHQAAWHSWRAGVQIEGVECCPLGMALPELHKATPRFSDVIEHLARRVALPDRPLFWHSVYNFMSAVDGGLFATQDEIYEALGCVSKSVAS